MQNENFPRLCGVCALAIERAVNGAECPKCKCMCHLGCLSGNTRGQKRCLKCLDQERRAQTSDSASVAGSRLSIDLPPAGLESTTVNRPVSQANDMQRQMDELKEMVKMLHTTIMGAQRSSVDLEQSTVENNRQSGSSESGSQNSSERPMNRTQASILASVRALPVTKQEMEFRRSCGDLPRFNGDPTRWFVFFSTYTETTAQCGFSASENLRRVKDALEDPARRRVQHYFEMPHRLDELMRTLEHEYGTPEALIRHVSEIAMTTPALREDLRNISEFYSVVLKIADSLDLLDQPWACPGLPDLLVRKMGMARGLDWRRFLCKRTATVALFQEYIGTLLEDVCQLQGSGLPGSLQSTSTTTAVKPKPKNDARLMLTDQKGSEPPAKGSKDSGQPAACLLGCQSLHKLHECQRFKDMTVKDRWALIKRTNRCAHCFGRHYMSKCKSATTCPYPGCTFKHHPMLHRETSTAPPSAGALVGVSRAVAKGTIYAVAQVTLRVQGSSIRAFAILDTASSTTFMRTGLARMLNLRGERQRMKVRWTDKTVHEIDTERIVFSISGADGQAHQICAQTMDDLALPSHTYTADMAAADGFCDLPLTTTDGVVPQLLIGLDNVQHIVASEMVVGRDKRMVAAKTSLGWVVLGRGEEAEEQCLLIDGTCDKLHQMVEQFIEADNFGLLECGPIRMSDENERAMALMRSNTRLLGERYETGLLWKSEDVVLPCNKAMADQRHQGLLRRLRRDPGLWATLDGMIEQYVAKGYAEEADERQAVNRVWYLPVFAVQNPNKPGKVRIVMDGAAEVDGVSLNTHLLTGPDLNAALVNVLMKFRRGRVAVSGDIREMFHQVKIRKQDRASQRFLWQFQGEQRPRTFEMQVMVFGAACSPTLAQYVKNTNAQRFEGESPEAVKAIVEQHYVDDYLDSRDTEEEVLNVARTVKNIHQRGGFEIHKFVSNAGAVTRALDGGENHIIEVSPTGALGLEWDPSNDCFSFRCRGDKMRSSINPDRLPTKRQLLRMAMALFDPLGFVAHITVVAKILLREAWRTETDWDEEIPRSCSAAWLNWLECLDRLDDQPIPRWYGDLGRRVELHVFVDASEAAIGAVVYAVRRIAGATTVAMVMAKCKVAPLRTKSIPRLELDAAVLGVRLLGIVKAAQCWPIDDVHMWSDARDVLYWIRCHKRRYTSYVANRVGTILRNTEVQQWRWTPTDQNPADWATKFIQHRGDEQLWRSGPAFLRGDRSDWPDRDDAPEEIREIVGLCVKADTRNANPRIPPIECFSVWERLVRNVACVQRWIDMCKRRTRPGQITADELGQAEVTILKEAQLGLSDKERSRWSAFLDEQGIWRMRGRTALAAHLSYEAKYPVILPADHQVSVLLMDFYHRHGQHCLDQRALNEFRKRFVMHRAKRMLNRVIRRCQWCVLQKTKPVSPEMAALPPCRVTVSMRRFTYTGADLFGPMTVVVGRRREKRWGVLFTCLSTRAVYIEVVSALSATACMMAMDSLAARRGPPVQYHSDNGTNFVAAAKQYRDGLGRQPRWVFNAPNAPHTGGAWERMIGITKKVLMRLGLEEQPHEDRLRWLLHKAEYLINSRPLAAAGVSEDGTSVSPNDLLHGPEPDMNVRPAITDINVKEYLAAQDRWVQCFWRRWTDEYLPTLAVRQKWRAKTFPLAVGDVVFLCDSDYRYGWRKGRIIEAAMDEESDQVRQVLVKTADGSVYRRHATKVAVLVQGANAFGKGECAE